MPCLYFSVHGIVKNIEWLSFPFLNHRRGSFEPNPTQDPPTGRQTFHQFVTQVGTKFIALFPKCSPAPSQKFHFGSSYTIPSYGGGNYTNGDLPQNIPHCPSAAKTMPPTLQQATTDPHLHRRLPGHPQACPSVGSLSLVLVHKVLLCLQELPILPPAHVFWQLPCKNGDLLGQEDFMRR